MINIFMKSIFTPHEVFKRNHMKGRLQTSIVMVIVTALLGTIFAPVVYYYTYKDKYDINLNLRSMFLGLSVSIITWLVVLTLFWLLSKAFKKGIRFEQVASTWGLSYTPNFLCIILYNLLLVKPEIYNGSGFSTFVICSFFIMFLIWKAIFYFILMRFVIKTTLYEITVITAVSTLVFIVLMIVGFRVGIQVPML